MAMPRNLDIKRMILVVLGSPLLGGFFWGVFNPPGGWDNVGGRIVHGLLAAPMSLFVMFVRPDKVQSWPFIAAAFLLLLFVAIRWPRPIPGAA